MPPPQLLDWYAGLNTEAQGAIAAVILTIIGFLVAFRTAHLAWIRQRRIELDLENRVAICAFFNEASSLLLKARSFASLLIEFAEGVGGGDVADAEFAARYINSHAEEFFRLRYRFSEMTIAVHSIQSKDTVGLSSHWGLIESLNKATEHLTGLGALLWFPVPRPAGDGIEFACIMAMQIDIGKTKTFVAAHEKEAMQMNVLAGKVCQQLAKAVSSINLAQLAYLAKNLENLGPAVEAFRSRKATHR